MRYSQFAQSQFAQGQQVVKRYQRVRYGVHKKIKIKIGVPYGITCCNESHKMETKTESIMSKPRVDMTKARGLTD